MLAQLVHGRAVPLGRGQHQDAVEIFGRRAQHAGAADVDFLHGFFQGEMALHSTGEVVEIDADQVKRPDALFGQGLHVEGVILVGQDARVDFGVQGFDAPAQNFRKAGHRADGGDGQARRLQHFLGAAGGNQLHIAGAEKGSEIHKAALVRNAQNGAADWQNFHTAGTP